MEPAMEEWGSRGGAAQDDDEFVTSSTEPAASSQHDAMGMMRWGYRLLCINLHCLSYLLQQSCAPRAE